MKRTLATALVLILAGCLGDLVKPAGEDGGPIDGGSDDGGAPDAGNPGDWPGDLAIRITTLVVDLNTNEVPDLVLLNDPPTEDDRGVLVLFDRTSGFFDAPDLFLSTETLHPLAVTTGDFFGGAPLDLMVLARGSADDTPYLIGFENSGNRTFTRSILQGFPGIAIGGGTVDDPTPVFAARTFIRDSSEASPGLVFGDLADARFISKQDWTSLSADDDAALAADSSTMNLALPVRSAQADRNDLLILDNQGAQSLQNDGSPTGDFDPQTPFTGLWPDQPRAFVAFDPEMDDLPDFMTLSGMQVHVGHVDWDGALVLEVRSLGQMPTFGDGTGDALFAVDIDGSGGMDLLVLDDVEPPADNAERFGLWAARDIHVVDADTAATQNGRFDSDVTHLGSPTRLVAGDFDNDGTVEVWVFDASLDFKMCLTGEVVAGDNYRFNECP